MFILMYQLVDQMLALFICSFSSSQLRLHFEIIRRALKICCIGLYTRDSDLIDLKGPWTEVFLTCSSGDSNAQARLRTTGPHHLKVYWQTDNQTIFGGNFIHIFHQKYNKDALYKLLFNFKTEVLLREISTETILKCEEHMKQIMQAQRNRI